MNYKDKRVLITGVGGFVGSYLAQILLKKGAMIFGTRKTELEGKNPKNLVDKKIIDKVKLIEADLLNKDSLIDTLKISKPDFIFHLAAQSSVHRSFLNPDITFEINVKGTGNLLEAVKIENIKPRILFAGTSDEYGFVAVNEKQIERYVKLNKKLFPIPEHIPETPISENNPIRPISPYAMSKVIGDRMMRDYYNTFGIPTIVARAFNHEGAGRGLDFVTSIITKQVVEFKLGKIDYIEIGNINALRDWSHVKDIVKGYLLILKKGKPGEIYNIGSGRTNSVLTYILLALKCVKLFPKKLYTIKNSKVVDNPLEEDKKLFEGFNFYKSRIDRLLAENIVEFEIEDEGIIIETDKQDVKIIFNKDRFRPSDIPLVICDNRKIRKLGFKINYSLEDIVKEQVKYFIKINKKQI